MIRRVGPPGGFQIELRISDRLTSSQQDVVVRGAERWMTVVRGPGTAIQEVGNEKLHGIVVHVTAEFRQKGGPLATTRAIRSWEEGPLAGLPRVAKVEFDTGDLDRLEVDGRLPSIAVHELGHALGFGLVWKARALMGKDAEGRAVFYGPAAMTEYGVLSGAGAALPVPIDAGVLSTNNHWGAKVFTVEAMGTFPHKGVRPLSRLTASSMVDLGYLVDLKAADDFKLDSP